MIAFDLDGTLVDTAPDLIGALNYILAEHGHDGLPLETARSDRRARRAGDARRAASRRPARRWRRPRWTSCSSISSSSTSAASPWRAARSRASIDALDALEAAGARFAVCTNKRTDLSLALLDALDLTRRFAAIVGPGPRRRLQARSGATSPTPSRPPAGGSDRALMVGDATTDTGAARAAGVPVIAVSFGYTDVPVAELGADALIDHFDELPAIARDACSAAPARRY